jgi:peroxiredoxin Q/BCP
MLSAGQAAPSFTLPDADMETISLRDFKNRQHVVLYFYPKDGTPGCTRQAIDFSDHEAQFLERDCVVIGVSGDDCLTHAEFRDEHGISIRLLSDADGDVCRAYGAWREDEANGQRCGVQRCTFVIDKSGKIRHALYGVSPKGHAMEVLNLVKALKSSDEN